ncbi:hypothetical protein EYC80_004883 [Monilinia laxa]|uniref:Uncharacterized protein n=1 Tax=Monilinia laxa TaxID=61186 RepID=A0A5N6KID3_MONLA|nr:hypothetical protein EYC80_004883 [Monilinia laxa]
MGKFCIIEARVERLLAGVVINVEGKLASYIQYNDTNRNRIYLADCICINMFVNANTMVGKNKQGENCLWPRWPFNFAQTFCQHNKHFQPIT